MLLEVMQVPFGTNKAKKGRISYIRDDEVLCIPDFGPHPLVRLIFVGLGVNNDGLVCEAYTEKVGISESVKLTGVFQGKARDRLDRIARVAPGDPQLFADHRHNPDMQASAILVKNLGAIGAQITV